MGLIANSGTDPCCPRARRLAGQVSDRRRRARSRPRQGAGVDSIIIHNVKQRPRGQRRPGHPYLASVFTLVKSVSIIFRLTYASPVCHKPKIMWSVTAPGRKFNPEQPPDRSAARPRKPGGAWRWHPVDLSADPRAKPPSDSH